MDSPVHNDLPPNKDIPRDKLRQRDCNYDVRRKADKISLLFSSLVEIPLSARSSSDEDALSKASHHKAQPRSQEEFYQRVSSFHPGLWTIQRITPLECASWGWKLLEKDVLQCVTCREVICAILPDRKDKVAYEKFFALLRERLETSHKDACGWLYNPCPREFMEPLVITTDELRNMKNSVQTLVALNSALPFLNNNRLTAILAADDEVIKGMLKIDDPGEETKITAVLLVLCGWCKGQGSFLRCSTCRRRVGLWSMINIADELKKTVASKIDSTASSSRKRKLSEDDDSPEEADNDNRRVTRQSPRKLKNQDVVDASTPKRKRIRSREEKEGQDMETNNADTNGDKTEYLLITSPSTEVEKVEKRYFSPLEEHRHWCPWITIIDDDDDDDDDDEPDPDPQKGFCIVTEQIRSILQLLDQRKSVSREKCMKNVEGLRIIRDLLDEASYDEVYVA